MYSSINLSFLLSDSALTGTATVKPKTLVTNAPMILILKFLTMTSL